MSTNAVAFLLLNQFRNGVSMEKLVEAMEKLKKDLFCAGRDVGFMGDMVDVINHAVSTSCLANIHIPDFHLYHHCVQQGFVFLLASSPIHFTCFFDRG
jgi:hypothetical protein